MPISLPRKTNKKQKAYKRGIWAEYWAAFFLFCQGYRILKRRYKTPVGEIDLILRRNKALVAVEVKAHRALDASLHAITPQQKARIQRGLHYFLMQNHLSQDQALRYDVVVIRPWRLPLHIKGAWQEEA